MKLHVAKSPFQAVQILNQPLILSRENIIWGASIRVSLAELELDWYYFLQLKMPYSVD